jgi:hypothetical protein
VIAERVTSLISGGNQVCRQSPDVADTKSRHIVKLIEEELDP